MYRIVFVAFLLAMFLLPGTAFASACPSYDLQMSLCQKANNPGVGYSGGPGIFTNPCADGGRTGYPAPQDIGFNVYAPNQNGVVQLAGGQNWGYSCSSKNFVPPRPSKNVGSACPCDGGQGQQGGDAGGNGSPPAPGAGGVFAGDPINTASGNKFLQEEDFAGSDWLVFRRFYNSYPTSSSTDIGSHWRHSFDRSLKVIPIITGVSPSILAYRPDGRMETYTKAGGQWLTDLDTPNILTEADNAQGVATGYTLFVAAQRHFETYDASGVLQSIVDTTGVGISLAYSTSQTPVSIAPQVGLLLTVTDSRGRQLNFIYDSKSRVHQITLPDGGVLVYGYDSNSNLTSVQFPDGKTRQYVYNESPLNGGTSQPNALTGTVDEAGGRYENTNYNSLGQAISSSFAGNAGLTQITYNSDGTSSVQYPLGLTSVMGYVAPQGVSKLTSLDRPCAPQCGNVFKSLSYDANGYPNSTTDFNNNVTTTTYDVNGLLDQRVDAAGSVNQRTTGFTWNATLRVPLTRTVLDNSGNTVASASWVYNTLGQPLARCEADSAITSATTYTCGSAGTAPIGVRQWTYSYCTAVDSVQCPLVGLMLTATGPRIDLAQTTTYSYYLSASAVSCGTPGAACYQPGDLRSVTDAQGHSTIIASYDANGRVTRVTDANGINTDTTYTPRGWLASRTVGGATTGLTYTPYGAVASITDPDGVVVSYTYDDAHRLTRITDALGNYLQYTLDAAGNKTAEQVFDSSGTLHRSLTRTYNTLGELTQVTDGLSHAVFNATYSDSYDANGDLVHTADALGVQRKQGYDGLNRLVQTLDDYNGTNTASQNTQSVFAYDANDRLQGVGDPDGLNTTYSYDGLGNATAVQSPDTGTTAYVYDAAGNVIQRTDANGVTSTSSYDALNRRIATTYTDSTLNVAYAYDEPNSTTGCTSSYPVGRLTRLIETNVTTVYCYDARGNVTQKSQIQGTATDITSYSYALADRLASTLTAAGTSIQYSRDADGRINGVTVLPPGTSGAGAGNVVTAVSYLPFGPITSYTLGNGQTITRSYDANYALTDIVSPALNLHFARDAMGDITALGSVSGANPATETYSYDPLYRLTGLYNASGTAEEIYTYSKAGDRLSKTSTGLDSGTYSYQSGTHHLVSIGNASRVYDLNGNTTGSVAGGNTYGFGYNGRNRITVAQLNGSTVGTYTYNALGQRTAKVATFPAATSQRFVYDESSQLLSEYGSDTRDYIWLDGMPVATVDTTGTTSTVSYVTADGLNTPRVVADNNGNTIWQLAYQGNPFGEQQPTNANGYTLNMRFPGQYNDTESGLNYNVNRYYEAATGRYIQSDPIGLAGGLASYSYVDSSPLQDIDLLGLKKVILFGERDSVFLQRANEYKDDPNACLVYSHGSPSFIYDTRGGTTKRMDDPQQIVNLLKAEGCTSNMPVIIYACRTGMGDNSIAEDISKTGAFPNVTAPTSYVWYNQDPTSTGPSLIFGKNANATMDTNSPGTMRTFP